MARGFAKNREAGITVRSLDDEPVRKDVAGFFRANPRGSLGELYGKGDTIRLYDDGVAVPVRIDTVRNRSLVGRQRLPDGEEGKVIRLVLERDAQGRVVGLKESGFRGRRVA